MTAVKFKEQNITFTEPDGMTDKECGSLPAYKNDAQIVSCWKLSLIERITILFSGIMWLGICGHCQPPIYMTVTSPFVEPPKVETET
jgi:hypothetical protein